MNLVLEYRLTARERRAHCELLHGRQIAQSQSQNAVASACLMAILLLALYVSWAGGQTFFACVFLVCLSWPIRALLGNRRNAQAALKEAASGPDRVVRLEVEEAGLRETVEGIESFVPWPAVRTFTVHQETLFLRLAAGLWAIVPLAAPQLASGSTAALIAELRRRGVPGENPHFDQQPVPPAADSQPG